MRRMLSLALFAVLAVAVPASAAEKATVIPSPVVDDAHMAGTPQTAVLAGGCYWGVQAVFQHVKGVTKAVAGYSGGHRNTMGGASLIAATSLDPAESVSITYDPSQISYGEILQIYFSVAHDPTQLNRQGPDHGTRYRSNIFYMNDRQKKIAESYIAQLQAAKVYAGSIVTRTDRFTGFTAAPDNEQNYVLTHPDSRYVVINDTPKLAGLKNIFPSTYRETPIVEGGS